jgi:hypothetical protein
MAQQVKWKFKGIDVSFVSPKDKLTLAVLKQAARLGIDPKRHKIEIENDLFTTNNDDAGCGSCNGNSPGSELLALQMDDEEIKTGPSPDDMRDMLRLLDDLSGSTADGSALDPDDFYGTDGSLAD